MDSNEMINRAEENIRNSRGKKVKKPPSGKSRPKLVLMMVLLLVLAAVAWNSWKTVKEMNTPPDLPREVVLENMGGYLFVMVSKLNSYMQMEGRIPETEEEFLGYDDPSVEYGISGGEYSVSVIYADTVLVWHSGDDPSKFLTEDALERMGIAN